MAKALPKKVAKKVPKKKEKNYPQIKSNREINDRFLFVKDRLGITYEQMAAEMKVAQVTLQAIGTYRANPNFYILRQMKKLYGVSYDYMIDGNNQPTLISRENLNAKVDRLADLIDQLNKKVK